MENLSAIIQRISEIDRMIAKLHGERRKLANRRDYLKARGKIAGPSSATSASSNKLETLRLAIDVLSNANRSIQTKELVKGIIERADNLKESTLRSHLLRLKREGALLYNEANKTWNIRHDLKE